MNKCTSRQPVVGPVWPTGCKLNTAVVFLQQTGCETEVYLYTCTHRATLPFICKLSLYAPSAERCSFTFADLVSKNSQRVGCGSLASKSSKSLQASNAEFVCLMKTEKKISSIIISPIVNTKKVIRAASRLSIFCRKQ